jgi:hypothetical protein
MDKSIQISMPRPTLYILIIPSPTTSIPTHLIPLVDLFIGVRKHLIALEKNLFRYKSIICKIKMLNSVNRLLF